MVGNDTGQKFLVDLYQVCWHPGQFFHLNLLKRLCLGWLLDNTDVQLPPQTLYWSEVQRLAGPLLDHPDGLRKTLDGPGHVLTESRGTFQVLHANVVWNEMATFGTVVSVLFRSLTIPPWVPGCFLTVLNIIFSPRGDILHGAQDWGSDFLLIAILTKLLAYCRLAHSSYG